MPELVHEFDYWVTLEFNDFGDGPNGHRLWVRGTDGEFSGERLKGMVTPGGGDWLIANADGFGRIDVRIQLQTHDGANIYVQYFGQVELTEKVLKWAAGEDVSSDYGEQYFFTNPRLETADPRYAWVNNTFFVGQGHVFGPPVTVEYRLFRVVN